METVDDGLLRGVSTGGPRALIVDDDPAMRALLEHGLAAHGIQAEYCGSAAEAVRALAERDFESVITDLNMLGMDGLELCEHVVANHPQVSVIVMTAYGSMESAVAAIRAGARDFIVKPFEVTALVLMLERAAQNKQLREEVRRLRLAVTESHRFEGILGASPAMRSVHDLLARVAESTAAVLVTGETGTGKELAARALHRHSHRRDGPFVGINCAAMPTALLESELFGHARGAFTDARERHAGLFQQADHGTLFLDEIGDMPLPLQPKLLRALQERVVRPVGGSAEIPFDVRIVSASNQDLEEAVDHGRFRKDLYFRLNVVQVELPPLRARGSDVLLLAQEFIDRFALEAGKPVKALSSAAAAKLLAYPWPGNVRELQNCIERAVALTRYEQLAVDDLPERVRDFRPQYVLVAGDDPTELVTLREMERRYVLKVLEAVGGRRTLAARVLGLDRKTLYRRLGDYAGEAGRAKGTDGAVLRRGGDLPASRAADAPQNGEHREAARGKRVGTAHALVAVPMRRVLVVDDEPHIRRIAEVSLAKVGGFEVALAATGKEALELVARDKPDVILLDVMMPVMDGRATLAHLKQNPATADIDVILMTATMDPNHLGALEELGIAGVISKPFDPMTLAAEVRRLLNA